MPTAPVTSVSGLKLTDGRYCAVFFGLDDAQNPPFVGVNSKASYPTQVGYLYQMTLKTILRLWNLSLHINLNLAFLNLKKNLLEL